MKTCLIDSPLGKIRASADDTGLTGLWFEGQKYYPSNAQNWTEAPREKIFVSLRAWLKDYFAGKKPSLTFTLAPKGTDFQKAVWKRLLTIPHGGTSSYGRLAAELGKPAAAARAVGGAVGHNPISIIIPCHRVLGSTGGLTGYAGGLDKKRALLKLEGAL